MEKPKLILVVDDDEQQRELTSAMLKSLGHGVEVAQDGFEALAKLKLDVDLVLLDAMMPGMDGYELARRIRQDPDNGDIPLIMVTSLTSKEDRLSAVEAGCNDFVAKPLELTELRVRTASLLKMKEAQDVIRRHEAELEQVVDRRTRALRESLESMAEAQRVIVAAHLDTIRKLAEMAEYKEKYLGRHIPRVSYSCGVLAQGLKLSPRDVEVLLYASALHDVGKIAVPDHILSKPGKLNEEEWKIMKLHTVIGAKFLSGSQSTLLQAGEVIALSHHERWDGSGYPKGLAGEEIPLYGRICGLADVFDALTSTRPFRSIAMTNEEAFELIRQGRGTQFDPRIVDVFFEKIGDILAVREEQSEEAALDFIWRDERRKPESALFDV